jgi:hypothetical protein
MTLSQSLRLVLLLLGLVIVTSLFGSVVSSI